MQQKVKLGITMGDPAGIGPEIIVKAMRGLQNKAEASDVELVVVGSGACLRAAMSAQGSAASDDILLQNLIDVGGSDASEIVHGKVDARCGKLAFMAIERAIASAMTGEIDAIVTAPLNKEALHRAGYSYPGHTEILRDLTRSADTCMMLAHGDFRVSHVTTHIALQDVPARVTPKRVRRVIELTQEALLNLGIARPRIGICALNPHAGEGGMFGHQDQEVLSPVIETMRSEGMDVSGPHPGDTVFVRARAGDFDAVVAMYHDQGHIPVKLLGFSVDKATGRWNSVSGVNITLGCPVIRTSVDHGTAFDIAGKGIANAQSMEDAIVMAARLAATKHGKAGGKTVEQTSHRGGINHDEIAEI